MFVLPDFIFDAAVLERCQVDGDVCMSEYVLKERASKCTDTFLSPVQSG